MDLLKCGNEHPTEAVISFMKHVVVLMQNTIYILRKEEQIYRNLDLVSAVSTRLDITASL